jgi:hypothetical protein
MNKKCELETGAITDTIIKAETTRQRVNQYLIKVIIGDDTGYVVKNLVGGDNQCSVNRGR